MIERNVAVYRQPERPDYSALAFLAAQVSMAEAKHLFEQFAVHDFAFGAIDLPERAAARADEQLGVRLTASISRADLSAAAEPDTLTLGETGPSGTSWLTLPCARETEETVQALRLIQKLLEYPALLL